ncbi:hypothetical protein EDD21DRAFT_297649, partial [Dissophora ornata]
DQVLQVTELNHEQQHALHTITGTRGLYLVTGSAGTGKSTLLKALATRIRQTNAYEPVILSPTGIAAVNVGGMTIHRFFG